MLENIAVVVKIIGLAYCFPLFPLVVCPELHSLLGGLTDAAGYGSSEKLHLTRIS